jgi:hypothetical protein
MMDLMLGGARASDAEVDAARQKAVVAEAAKKK